MRVILSIAKTIKIPKKIKTYRGFDKSSKILCAFFTLNTQARFIIVKSSAASTRQKKTKGCKVKASKKSRCIKAFTHLVPPQPRQGRLYLAKRQSGEESIICGKKKKRIIKVITKSTSIIITIFRFFCGVYFITDTFRKQKPSDKQMASVL